MSGLFTFALISIIVILAFYGLIKKFTRPFVKKLNPRKRRALLDHLKSKIPELRWEGNNAFGNDGAMTYQLRMFPGPDDKSDNSETGVSIGIPLASDFELTIGKRSLMRLALTQMGMGSQVESADAKFNSEFSMTSASAESAKVCMDSPERREVVRKIFALGFEEIFLNAESLWASRIPFSIKDEISFARTKELVGLLKSFGTNLPILGTRS